VIVYSKRLFQKELELVGALQRAGVPLMTGTDLSIPYIFAGFSRHDELELFVQAGLIPMEALCTATRNPAEYLGMQNNLGTVERGEDCGPRASRGQPARQHQQFAKNRCSSAKRKVPTR
jgi:imidazolonepropionase-like amidohydrolase